METDQQQEQKPCWKCGTLLTINAYGYALCRQLANHSDLSEAVVFGNLPVKHYTCAAHETTFAVCKLKHSPLNLLGRLFGGTSEERKKRQREYMRNYYYKKTKPERQLAKQR